MNIGNNVNFNQREAQSLVTHSLSSAPGSPVAGQRYYNTTSNIEFYWNGSAWVSTAGGGITALTGDVTASGSGSVAATVAFVGGVSAASVATAVGQAHTQHTDTGTTNATFQLNAGASGFKIKDSSGEAQVRNAADNAYANIRVLDAAVTGDMVITGNLTVNGTNTVLNTTTMETGDNEVVLNSEITTSAGNTDGGIALKRLHTDNSTRRDAKIVFDEATTYRWQAVYGISTAAVQTKAIALVHAETIGDTTTTQFTIMHNLNTEDVTVAIRYAAGTKEMILTDWRTTGATSIRVDFAVAPGANEFRVVVIG